MLRRCNYIIVKLDLRSSACSRWLSSEGQNKALEFFLNSRQHSARKDERDCVLPRPNSLPTDERNAPISYEVDNVWERNQNRDGATNITQTLSLQDNSKAADITVESLMERMNGDPLNIKSRNPLALALASIQREKDEFKQIFGAPVLDDMVLGLGKTPLDPNSYDIESYKQYRLLLDKLLFTKKFNKIFPTTLRQPLMEWLYAKKKTVEIQLPSLDNALEEGLEVFQDIEEFNRRATQFRKELHNQRNRFFKQTGLDAMHLSAATAVLASVGRLCANMARSLPLEIAWEKTKEAGMEMEGDTLVNYLHVVSSYPGRANVGLLGNISSLSMLDEKNQEFSAATVTNAATNKSESDIRAEIAIFHDLLHKPSEKSLSIRVKNLVSQGKAAQAEALLDQFADTTAEGLKQRTYLPIFKQYIEQRNIPAAMKLFSKLKNEATVILTEETYIQFIATIAESGFFSHSADPIDGAADAGYSPACGPRLFDQLANEMAENCSEISSDSARRLYNAFERGFRGTPMAWNVDELRPLSPPKPCNEPALPGNLILNRVNVDSRTGVCPRSGVTLRLLEFTAGQKQQFTENLFRVGLEKKETRKATYNRNTTNARHSGSKENPMKEFATWLNERSGKPFTAIIDGGNVGYHMQNFDDGRFSYHQLQFLVTVLEKLNENPLIVLLPRLTYDRIRLNPTAQGPNQFQVLTDQEKEIRNRLLLQQKLYSVPGGWHDDLFLMVATLSAQGNARKGMDLSVEPNNSQGRWPGIRPVLITNDQLRDHWPDLLERKLFRRWYSSCVVNFQFVGFVGGECADDSISFSPGEFFSRDIQSNIIRTDRGQETVWHFPVSDWGNDAWFCIKIPS